MPSRAELVAYGRDTEEIAEAIGADLVIFQTLPDLVSSVRQFNTAIETFDCSVFTGEYITGGVDEEYLCGLEKLRGDNVQGKAQVGDLGVLEGKGGGGVNKSAVNGTKEAHVGNGVASGNSGGHKDDTVGLHNGFGL